MIGINQTYNGDCLEVMKGISDKSVDMILCDLPYGTTACKWDVVIPFEPLWMQYKRIIKDNGTIVLFGSQPFTSLLICSNLKMFKYEWIWEKSCPTGVANSNYMPMKYHENTCVFYKSLPIFNKQMAKRNPNWNRAKYLMMGSSNKSNHVNMGKQPNKQYDPDYVNPKSVLYFGSVNNSVGKLHPTQKPVALFEYLIRTYTNENELVLDNCAGSGTTGIACMNTNRNYIMIEKEKKYFDIIIDRIEKHSQQYKMAI